MKKAFSILFLFIFAFNIIGFYLLLKVEQKQIKKEIKNKIKKSIPNNQLTVIQMNPDNENEFDWMHEKEFRYKGMMFDIVRKVVSGEKQITFYCINDEAETRLFANLDNLVQKSNEKNNKSGHGSKFLSKLFTMIYLIPGNLSIILLEKNNRFFNKGIDFYKSPFLEINLPPPILDLYLKWGKLPHL